MATRQKGAIVDVVMQSAHYFAPSSSFARNGHDVTVHHDDEKFTRNDTSAESQGHRIIDAVSRIRYASIHD